MKELIYDSAKGIIWYRDGDQTTRLGRGYSGHPPYTNQPAAEALVAQGPIPRGRYRVHSPIDHVRLGRLVYFLEPKPGTQMHRRSGFFIHGDNKFGNLTASHGCIILPRSVRAKLCDYLPVDLVVVGEEYG